MLKYAVGLLLLVTIGVLYSKYKDKHNSMNDARKYKLVQQFSYHASFALGLVGMLFIGNAFC